MKRINSNIPDDLYLRWTNAVPRGMRTLILTALINMVCILVDHVDRRVLGMILDKRVILAMNDEKDAAEEKD